MTSARTNKIERDHRHESPVSKVLEDRIAADGEQVLHTLDPKRTFETVRYPDPEAPTHDPTELAPQSNAEIQMARRTDAGPVEVVSTGPMLSARGPTLILWGVALAGILLVVLVIVGLT